MADLYGGKIGRAGIEQSQELGERHAERATVVSLDPHQIDIEADFGGLAK